MADRRWDDSDGREFSYLSKGLLWFVCGFVSALVWVGILGPLIG